MVIASQVGDSSVPVFAEGKQGFLSQDYSTFFFRDAQQELLFLAKYRLG